MTMDAIETTETMIPDIGKVPATMVNQTPKGIQAILDRFKDRIAAALPGTITPERMVQIATQLISRNPDIQKCSTPSIIGAIFQAATLGLDLTPALGQAAIIPYWNGKTKQTEAQFQIMYRGLIQLARRSGEIKSLSAHVVYENDHFEYELGLNPRLEHKPILDSERGMLKYAYAVWHFKDGGYYFDVMTRKEIFETKERSAAVKGGRQTPWDTDEAEMWKKTVIKRSSKYVPIAVSTLADLQVRDEIVTTPEQYDDKGFDLLGVPPYELVEPKETRLAPAETLKKTPEARMARRKPKIEPALTRDEATEILERMGNSWEDLPQDSRDYVSYEAMLDDIGKAVGKNWREYKD